MLRYLKFCAVGALVGLSAVALLTLLERLLPDTATAYLAAVVAVYAGGILLSYLLQRSFTFSDRSAPLLGQSIFVRFLIVALLGCLLTSALSYFLKYRFPWPAVLGRAIGPASFGVACLLSSLVSFTLNQRWVFQAARR